MGSFEKAKPCIAMICLQFGYAGMNIITKVSLNRGMSHFVLVVYRNAFATAVIAPFAILLERKVRPKITFKIFMHVFVLGLLGPVIDQNLYYAGLKYTSPTFSCAMSNMLPALTFVIALICRMEKVHIRKLRCLAKVVGTIVTVAGAILMTLYRGHVINMVWSNFLHPTNVFESSEVTDKDWIKGSIVLILATLAWASFFLLQAITMKEYKAHLSLTALVCLMGTLQSTAVTYVMEHRRDAWAIGFDMNLLAAAYAGIVSSSIACYVRGIVMQRRGPVFVTAFSPLMMVIVAIMGSFILAEKTYVGGVLGAVLIVIGMYSVLWGKYREFKEIEEEEIFNPVKDGDIVMNFAKNGRIIEDIEANNHVEMKRNEAERSFVPVVISSPAQNSPMMIAIEAPKA